MLGEGSLGSAKRLLVLGSVGVSGAGGVGSGVDGLAADLSRSEGVASAGAGGVAVGTAATASSGPTDGGRVRSCGPWSGGLSSGWPVHFVFILAMKPVLGVVGADSWKKASPSGREDGGVVWSKNKSFPTESEIVSAPRTFHRGRVWSLPGSERFLASRQRDSSLVHRHRDRQT